VPVSVLGEDAEGRALLQRMRRPPASTAAPSCVSTVTRLPRRSAFSGACRTPPGSRSFRYDIEDRFDVAEDESLAFTKVLRELITCADAAPHRVDYGHPGVGHDAT